MTDAFDATAEPPKRMNRRRLAVIVAVAAVLGGYWFMRALDDAACACDPPIPVPVAP